MHDPNNSKLTNILRYSSSKWTGLCNIYFQFAQIILSGPINLQTAGQKILAPLTWTGTQSNYILSKVDWTEAAIINLKIALMTSFRL